MPDTEFDALIAAYLIPDLAKHDFDGLVGMVADKQLEVEGVALVTVDREGEVTVNETGDRLGRRGTKIGGGVGLVVGLLAPPLPASDKIGEALPPGSAGIIVIHDRTKTDVVDKALVSGTEVGCAG